MELRDSRPDAAWAVGRPARTTLSPYPVIGRDQEIERLVDALQHGSRRIAIVGPAGMGKSVLVREALAGLPDPFDAPVVWCDLHGARSHACLRAALGRSLDISPHGTTRAQAHQNALTRALASRGRSVLVLDGIHSLSWVEDLLQTWLTDTQTVVLLTSRDDRSHSCADFTLHLRGLDESVMEVLLRRQRLCERPTDPLSQKAWGLIQASGGNPRVLELLACDWLEAADAATAQRHSPSTEHLLRMGWEREAPEGRNALLHLAPWSGPMGTDVAVRLSGMPEVHLNRLARCGWLNHDTASGGFTVPADVRTFVREMDPSGYAAAVPACVGVCLAPLETQLSDVFDGGVDAVLNAVVEVRTVIEGFLDDLAELDHLDPEQRQAVFRTAHVLHETSDDGVSPAHGQVVERALGQEQEGLLAAQAATALVKPLLLDGRFDDAIRYADIAELGANRAGSPAAAASALVARSLALARSGRPREAVEAADRALLAFRLIRHTWGEARALLEQASWLSSLGNRDEAMAGFDRARVLFRRVSHGQGQSRALAGSGVILMEEGNHRAARERFEEATDVADRTRAQRMALVARGYLGLLHMLDGGPDEAAEQLAAVVQRAGEVGDVLAESYFAALACSAFALCGEIPRADAYWEQAIAGLPPGTSFHTAARIHHGLLALARSRTADEPDATDLVGAALAARALATPTALAESDDVRLASRLLDRAIAASRHPASSPPPPARPRMLVAADGTWFNVGNGLVTLNHRPLLCSLLKSLVQASSRGTLLSARALIALLWPEEDLLPSVAMNRLNVALSTLRKAGLREHLLREPDGYRLADGVSIE